MGKQLTLKLNGQHTRGRITLSDADRKLIETTPLEHLPESLLIEMRSQRIGCSPSELRCMRSYELSRELSEELVFIALGDLDGHRNAYRPNWGLIDSIVKREAAERIADFEEWRKQKDTVTEAKRKRGE